MNHDAQVDGIKVVLSWKEQTRNNLKLINIFSIYTNKLRDFESFSIPNWLWQKFLGASMLQNTWMLLSSIRE